MALPSSDGYLPASIPSGQLPASQLSDVPVLIYIGPSSTSTAHSDYWAKVDTTDPTRARFTNDVPGELAFDPVYFDSNAEEAVFRVNMTSVASSGTERLRCYPPRSANSSYSETDTYGQHAAYPSWAIAHLPLTEDLLDHTGNNNDPTTNGGISAGGATGEVGPATVFDGTDDFLEFGDIVNTDSSFSYAIVFSSASGITQDGTTIFDNRNASNLGTYFGLRGPNRSDDPDAIDALFQPSSTSPQVHGSTSVIGETRHAVYTWDDNNFVLEAYVDGASEGTASESTGDSETQEPLRIGQLGQGFIDNTGMSRPFEGNLQHAWVISDARPTEWAELEASMTREQGAFWNFGSYQTITGPSLDDKTIDQHTGIAEWLVSTSNYTGSAVGAGLEATATFTHQSSGKTVSTGFFYDGGNTFGLRFSAAESGTWNVSVSASNASALDGMSATITVGEHDPHDYTKELTIHNNRICAINGDGTFQGLYWNEFQDTREKMNSFGGTNRLQDWEGNEASKTQTQASGAGMLGEWAVSFLPFTPQLLKWGAAFMSDVSSSEEDPLPRAFRILDKVLDECITQNIHAKIHFWSDTDSSLSPEGFTNGTNGAEHTRFIDYVAARLGAHPNWSLYQGTDLQEWLAASEAATIQARYDDNAVRTHLAPARGFASESGQPVQNPGNGDYEDAGLRTNSYSTAVDQFENPPQNDGLQTAVDMPDIILYSNLKAHADAATEGVLYEEGYYPGKAMEGGNTVNEMEFRRMFWRAAFASQVGIRRSGEDPTQVSNPEYFATFHEFFAPPRLKASMVADNSLVTSNGYALRASDDSRILVYEEGTGSIGLDLSSLSGAYDVTAVDATVAYSELSEGTVEAGGTETIAPDNGTSSDWALALNAAGGGARPSLGLLGA